MQWQHLVAQGRWVLWAKWGCLTAGSQLCCGPVHVIWRRLRGGSCTSAFEETAQAWESEHLTLILWIYPSLTRQTKTLSFIWGLAIFFYFQEAQTVITGMWGSPRRVNNLVFLQTDEKYLLWRNRVLVNKNFMQIALKKKRTTTLMYFHGQKQTGLLEILCSIAHSAVFMLHSRFSCASSNQTLGRRMKGLAVQVGKSW